MSVNSSNSKCSHTVSSSNSKCSHTNVNAEKNVYQLHVITSKEFITRFPHESSTPINESTPIWEEIKTPT